MKRKEKRITILGLSVLMCSLVLVTIPVTAIAAEQDDYVLGIYGNANEDDTIDMRDLTYVKLIFFGKKPETKLADAKYDGKINPLDFIQIKLIIVGKEKELTIIDTVGKIVTVNKPVKRIIPVSCYCLEVFRTLKAADKIVGISSINKKSPKFFGELTELPIVVESLSPDYEILLNLEPDLVILYDNPGWSDKIEDQLKSLNVKSIRLECGDTMVSIERDFGRNYVEEIIKLGYILDKRDEAEEYCDWYEEYIDKIKSRTNGLSEEDKPRVYTGQCGSGRSGSFFTYGSETGWQWIFDITGARNLAFDLPGRYAYIDPEWLIEQNPDIILDYYWPYLWSGYETDDMTEIIAQREVVMNNPVLTGITAVKSGRVYLVHTDVTFGAAHIVGLAYIAKWCHPDLFEDLDPKAIHQEYLTRFQGLDYDLDKHGVFVYHPHEHPDGK